MRKIKNTKPVKGENRRREIPRKGVVVQKQRLEVDECGQVRNGSGERVIMEAQNSELIKTSQGVGSEVASETKPLSVETHNPALHTLHAPPLTVVKALIQRVQKLVIQVRLGLERQKRNGVAWQQRAHRRCSSSGGGGNGEGEEKRKEEEREELKGVASSRHC